tara:strand:+ start:1056 stop:1358 length:303 start_codon:yes stop_codon:yes gene_type:complete
MFHFSPGTAWKPGFVGMGMTSMPVGLNVHCRCTMGSDLVFPTPPHMANRPPSEGLILALAQGYLREQGEDLPVHVCPKCGPEGSANPDMVLGWMKELRDS